MKRRELIFVIGAICASVCSAIDLRLPNKKESFHFAVIGDTGTGGRAQYEVAAQLTQFHNVFPFEVVLMLGDNIYGSEKPNDFVQKFERPYEQMLKGGVKFFAALGNHDDPNQRMYKPFNMNGERYYTFKPRDRVRLFSLDSNYLDRKQIEWLEKELKGSDSDWKMVYFHHPLFSSGEAHGPAEQLRKILEPLFIQNNVSIVFSGHEHFYERLKPQKGIYYFIQGGSAKLRIGDIRRTPQSAKGFDKDNSFILCEIDGDEMHFQTISRLGDTIDEGTIHRRAVVTAK